MARLISVVRDGRACTALGDLRLEAGDQAIAIPEPGGEDALRRAIVEGHANSSAPGGSRSGGPRRPGSGGTLDP